MRGCGLQAFRREPAAGGCRVRRACGAMAHGRRCGWSHALRRARRSSCRAGGTGRATSVKFSEWPTNSRPPGLHHARACARAPGAASARRNRSSRCGRTRCRTARRATSCASIRLSARNSISRASSGLTRMKPALAPVPRRKWRRSRSGDRPRAVGGVDAALRGGQHLGVDVAGEDARRRRRAPSASTHGHRDRIRLLAGRRGVAPDAQRAAPARARRSSASAWKWCSSRKNEVRLVVRQLTNSCHSASPPRRRLLEPLQVVGERAVAGLAQAARQPAVDHGLLAGVQADAGALVDQLRARARSRLRRSVNSCSAASQAARSAAAQGGGHGAAVMGVCRRDGVRRRPPSWARCAIGRSLAGLSGAAAAETGRESRRSSPLASLRPRIAEPRP